MNSIFDLLNLIASNTWLYGGTFVLVLSILVFVHEWGHYIVARMCGVRIETFSIGFGKEIVGYTDSHSTRWKVSLIPLGGYVKMFGDTDPASAGHAAEVQEGDHARPMTAGEQNVAFFAKPVWKRAAIVFAGPAINFLFAIVVLTCLYSFYGQPVTPPMASAVIEDSAAAKAGFKPHDKVLTIDGKKVQDFEDIRREVMIGLDHPMNFVVEREGETITLQATPKKEIITDHFGFEHSRGLLGIIGPANGIVLDNIVSVNGKPVKDADAAKKALKPNLGRQMTIGLKRSDEQTDILVINPAKDLNVGWTDSQSPDFNVLIVASKVGNDYVKHGLIDGTASAIQETWDIATGTLKALGQMFTGMRSPTELGGIIRIGAIAGDMAQAGIIALISFTALLSINLGLINLFPIPMLDGGHLVFYAVEAARGSPIPEKMQEYAFRFGLAVLVGIMIFANLNDIIQLIL